MADDWIAEQAGPDEVVVTADIPLAARCLGEGTCVLYPKSRPLTDNDICAALAMRDLIDGQWQDGAVTSVRAPMTPKERSRFLSKLDEGINAVRRVPLRRRDSSMPGPTDRSDAISQTVHHREERHCLAAAMINRHKGA